MLDVIHVDETDVTRSLTSFNYRGVHEGSVPRACHSTGNRREPYSSHITEPSFLIKEFPSLLGSSSDLSPFVLRREGRERCRVVTGEGRIQGP